MPILPVEPMCFPEQLFEEHRADLAERFWWVLHTRPRQEKSLSRHLREHRVPFYLPLIRNRLLVRGVPTYSHLPLFDGYVFLLATESERVIALSSRRVVRSLRVVDQEQLREDLFQVHCLLSAGRPVTAEQELLPGTIVTIRNGPLTGLRGTILRTASGNRFVVRVDFIQRGASVLLDGRDLVAPPAGTQAP
jgi:transcriptional antiterminator RfaH